MPTSYYETNIYAYSGDFQNVTLATSVCFHCRKMRQKCIHRLKNEPRLRLAPWPQAQAWRSRYVVTQTHRHSAFNIQLHLSLHKQANFEPADLLSQYTGFTDRRRQTDNTL